MKTHRLTAALAFCSLAVAGCSPGTVVRCALTDLLTAEPGPQPADTRTVPATVETAPVPDACDAADDPAVWVNESDPEASLIVATNKLRGLVVYGLDGAVVSSNDVGRVNNVDLRDGVDVGGEEQIVVAATNRTHLDDRRPRARPRQRRPHAAARRPHLAGLRRGSVRPLPVPQRGERRICTSSPTTRAARSSSGASKAMPRHDRHPRPVVGGRQPDGGVRRRRRQRVAVHRRGGGRHLALRRRAGVVDGARSWSTGSGWASREADA